MKIQQYDNVTLCWENDFPSKNIVCLLHRPKSGELIMIFSNETLTVGYFDKDYRELID